MAEQISSDNTKKLLLEGGGAKAAPQPRPHALIGVPEMQILLSRMQRKNAICGRRGLLPSSLPSACVVI